MDSGPLIIGVIASIVAIFGLCFTVFWSIIRSMESRLCQKITSFEKIVSAQEEKFGTVFKEIKIEKKYCEENYVRKREHELEFALLKEKLDSMKADIKALKTMIENGNKK